jgi:ribosome-associated protein
LRYGVRTLKAKKAPAKKPAAKKAAKKASPKKKPASKPKPQPKSQPKAQSKAKPKAPARKKVVSKAKARAKVKPVKPKAQPAQQSDLLKRVIASLDDDKAENIVTIDLEGRSALCDAAVIASGRSSRHVAAMAEHLARRLKEGGYGTRPISGAATGDWVLVDAGDIIVHIFRPEVRDYYDLEGMWNVESPAKAG